MSRYALMLVLLAAAAHPAAGAPAALSSPAVREAMQEIHRDLRTVLREAVDQRAHPRRDAWSDSAASRRTSAALRSISDQAALLADHAQPSDELSSFLAAALDRMASLTAFSYESREWLRWQSYLFRMTDLCVACHARLPGASLPLGEDFLDPDLLGALPLPVRAELLTATRRFEPALRGWRAVIDERLSRWATRPPPEITSEEAHLLVRPVGHALVIALRVLQDFDAARDLFGALSRHAATPESLRPSVVQWARSTSSLRMARTVGPDGAEELIAAGDLLDRETIAGGLVHHVVASASLHRSLDVAELAAAPRARVLYLLGMAEHRIELALGPPGEVPWFPQTELLLELAILADPQTDTARRAYRLLERLVTAAYPGGLPEELAHHLAGLKARSGV